VIVTLYHGTSTSALPDILKNGIKPRPRGTKGNWDKAPSARDRVYLTRGYALYFAMHAADITGSKPVVIEVEVPGFKLVPDEDGLEQLGRHGDDDAPGDMWERTAWYAEHADEFDYGASLDTLGTVAHEGPIPPQLIKRVAIVDSKALVWLCDPTITVMNHCIMGAHYDRLTKFIFGDDPVSDLEDISPPSVDWDTVPRDGIEPVPLTFA
jgi:hypothetical protein